MMANCCFDILGTACGKLVCRKPWGVFSFFPKNWGNCRVKKFSLSFNESLRKCLWPLKPLNEHQFIWLQHRLEFDQENLSRIKSQHWSAPTLTSSNIGQPQHRPAPALAPWRTSALKLCFKLFATETRLTSNLKLQIEQ